MQINLPRNLIKQHNPIFSSIVKVKMNDTAISIDQQFFEAAFYAVLDAERELSEAKTKLDEATTLLSQAKNGTEKRLADAWLQVEKMMAENGEYECIIPSDTFNYKISYSTPRQSVKIINVDAVPDELCKIERKPRLKEIGDLLKAGEKHNWASLEYGEKHLQWKVVKNGN